MHATKPLMSVITNSLTGFPLSLSLPLFICLLPPWVARPDWFCSQYCWRKVPSLVAIKLAKPLCHSQRHPVTFRITPGPKKNKRSERMQFPLYSATSLHSLCLRSLFSIDGFARWLQPGQAGLMQSFLSGNVQVRTSRFVASALAFAWAELGS